MRFVKLLALVSIFLFISGCGLVETGRFLVPEKEEAKWVNVTESYDQTQLEVTDAAEVLETIYDANEEILSQSESILAASGQSKGDMKFWLRMVRFSEDDLTAERKYVLQVDERPKQLFVEPWPGLRLKSAMVLDEETLNAPFSDENSRRIRIFEKVLENLRTDFSEIKQQDSRVHNGGMMINQAMVSIMHKLEKFPSSAVRLAEEGGLEAHHPNLDTVKMQMNLEGDIVRIKLLGGSFVKTKDWHEGEW